MRYRNFELGRQLGSQVFWLTSESENVLRIFFAQLLTVELGHTTTVTPASMSLLAKIADKVLPVPVPLRFNTLPSRFTLNAINFCISFGGEARR